MKRVIVIGAGFSGMSLAYFLVKKGCVVTIIDQRDRVGGMISTQQTSAGIYETAANGFLNTAMVERFLQDIQADYLGSSREAKKRYIFRERPRRWPFGILDSCRLIWNICFFLGRKNVNRLASPRESVVGWADQNFTPAFADYLLGPALQGIYAGNLQKLSASLVLNPMIMQKREKKLSPHSLFSSQMGMGNLMSQLKEFLQLKGVHFQLNQPWTSEVQADHVVIATSAVDAESILKQMPSPEAQANAVVLKNIEMNSLVTTTCFFERPPKKYSGFGILFPRSEKIRALGVLMNTVIFNRNSKNHSETWIYGGALDPEFVNYSDEKIKNAILNDRKQVFFDPQEILEIKITRWPKGLPHYTIEHEKLIALIKPMIGVSLHGNYLGSIGLSRIFEKSEILADQITSEVL